MIRKLLGRPAAAPLRFWLWANDARRDARAVKAFAKGHGLRVIDVRRSPILDSSGSKKLFILGSGWSVNELSDEMVQHIGDHQSVGINFWFFHNFVPTAYSFDAGRVLPADHVHVRDSLLSLGVLFGRQSIRDAKPQVLYLRPYRSNSEYLVPLPAELRGFSWVSGRANLVSKQVGSVEADLRLLIKRVMNEQLSGSALPDNGSSVVRLVFLALAQGFTEIVLVGIDLDARPHFWFSPEYTERYPDYVALFPKPDGEQHGTTESANRSLGNREFLIILGRVLAELGVAKLLVGSPTSQLASDLPLYRWPDSKKRR